MQLVAAALTAENKTILDISKESRLCLIFMNK